MALKLARFHGLELKIPGRIVHLEKVIKGKAFSSCSILSCLHGRMIRFCIFTDCGDELYWNAFLTFRLMFPSLLFSTSSS